MRTEQALQVQRLGVALRAQAGLAQRCKDGLSPLERMLKHAGETVARHRDRSPGRRLQDIDLLHRGSLASAPERFLSDRFGRGQLIAMTTSGTSGVPVTVLRDPASHFALIHDTYRIVFERVAELGPPAPGEVAVAVVNDNPRREEMASLSPALDFAAIHRIVLNRKQERDLAAPALVQEQSPRLLYGRPRSLLRLADLSETTGRPARPRAILCSGDNLYADERERLEAVFGARVYNAYASQEGGFIAMECRHRRGLHVLAERAVVEVLPHGETDPAPEGTGELIVSNLENFAMPVLRYRTGDRGRVGQVDCPCGHSGTTIVEIDGRDSPYFEIDGSLVNPSVLNPALEALPIRQFQIVQRADACFDVKWVAKVGGDADPAAVERGIVECLGAVGATEVAVERVASIGAPEAKVQRYVRETR